MINKNIILRVVLLAVVTVVLQGCANFNYKRFTYDILRQEDCRRNDIDPFCARSFVFEYDEYEQMRQDYIHSKLPHAYGKHKIDMEFLH